MFHSKPLQYIPARPSYRSEAEHPPRPAHILPTVRTYRPSTFASTCTWFLRKRHSLSCPQPAVFAPFILPIPKPSKEASQSKVSGILSCRPGQPTLPSLVSHSIVILGQSFAIVQSLPSRSLQNLFQRHCITTPHQKLLYYTRNPYLTFSQFVRFPVLFRALHCLTQACTYYTALLSAQLVLCSTAVTRLQLHVTLELGLIPTAVTGISKRLTSPGSPHLTSAFRALYGTAPRPIGRCPMVHNNAR